ncbi:unnamed protein product, partial [Mesorhabditis belari]|uniref:Carboxylesterase type B domain-containing protein n=1 Tax=Mesorhabditis belari TaxID=2138241 RepID=A0AAF3EPK0_9BILA
MLLQLQISILFIAYCNALPTFPDFGSFAFAKTEYGVIQGKIEKHENTFAEVYNSVPFAANPTGDLRFESPKAPAKWQRPFETNFEVLCPQYHIVPAISRVSLNESENCLFLKVIIPLRNDKKRYTKLPIVYWIHGMSYTKGGKYVYRSSGVIKNFASQKIIFIAVDYRLGFDGFLSLFHPELSGNFGFEDILFGLEFVKRNAENFGGDPNRIILGGESVGGSLAGLLAASPKARGLISGAMLFSGTSLTSWAQRNEFTRSNSETIIAHCNCTRNDPFESKECMKKVNASCYRENLYNVKWEFLWDSPERLMYEILRMGFTLATPTVDGYRGDRAVLPKNPLELVKKSSAQNVSFLISHVAHERATGMLYSVWGSQLPASHYVNAMVYAKTPGFGAIRKVLRERYIPLGDVYNLTEITRLLTNLVQDELLSDGEKEGMNYAEKGNNVYMVVNDVFGEPQGGINMSLASEHCMDMVFLFDEPHLCNPLLVLSDEMKQRGSRFVAKFSKLIADFVHNNSIRKSLKYGPHGKNFLLISSETMKNQTFSQDSYYFWQEMVPALQRINATLPELLQAHQVALMADEKLGFAWREFAFGLTISLLLTAISLPTLYYFSRKRVQTKN